MKKAPIHWGFPSPISPGEPAPPAILAVGDDLSSNSLLVRNRSTSQPGENPVCLDFHISCGKQGAWTTRCAAPCRTSNSTRERRISSIRFAAVLVEHVVGYSRLIRHDEERDCGWLSAPQRAWPPTCRSSRELAQSAMRRGKRFPLGATTNCHRQN